MNKIPTVDLRSISVQNTQTQKTTATRYWFCGSVPMSIRRLWFFVFYGRRELFYFGEVILIMTGQTCLTEKLFWWLAQSTTCFTRYYNNGNSWRTQYTDDVQTDLNVNSNLLLILWQCTYEQKTGDSVVCGLVVAIWYGCVLHSVMSLLNRSLYMTEFRFRLLVLW